MSGEDVSEELAAVASSIDLTEYEITAYLAVLEHGDLTASEIAERTTLPQPRVYDTVRTLADRGLVELRESRPLRVLAVDPRDSFGDLQVSLDQLVEALGARYVAPTPETEAAALVKSRSSILRYFEDVIDSAAYELTVALTPQLVTRFEESLAGAVSRGVRCSMVVAPAADAPDPDAFSYARVATTARGRSGVTTPVLAIADGEYSVYATQAAVRNDDNHYAAIFNRSALGFLVLGFFGTVIWSTADRILLADQPTGDVPRHYASLRRCIKDIRRIEGSVSARVRGRDVVTGRDREVVGDVVSTRMTENEEVATLVLSVDGERVEVGGRLAAYEDIEAHEIELLRELPRR